MSGDRGTYGMHPDRAKRLFDEDVPRRYPGAAPSRPGPPWSFRVPASPPRRAPAAADAAPEPQMTREEFWALHERAYAEEGKWAEGHLPRWCIKPLVIFAYDLLNSLPERQAAGPAPVRRHAPAPAPPPPAAAPAAAAAPPPPPAAVPRPPTAAAAPAPAAPGPQAPASPAAPATPAAASPMENPQVAQLINLLLSQHQIVAGAQAARALPAAAAPPTSAPAAAPVAIAMDVDAAAAPAAPAVTVEFGETLLPEGVYAAVRKVAAAAKTPKAQCTNELCTQLKSALTKTLTTMPAIDVVWRSVGIQITREPRSRDRALTTLATELVGRFMK